MKLSGFPLYVSYDYSHFWTNDGCLSQKKIYFGESISKLDTKMFIRNCHFKENGDKENLFFLGKWKIILTDFVRHVIRHGNKNQLDSLLNYTAYSSYCDMIVQCEFYADGQIKQIFNQCHPVHHAKILYLLYNCSLLLFKVVKQNKQAISHQVNDLTPKVPKNIVKK